MNSADVVVVTPDVHAIADARAVQAPELSSSAAHLDSWDAKCTNDCTSQWITACFSVPVGTWSDEVGSLAQAKIDEIAWSTSIRARGDGGLVLVGSRNEGNVAIHDLLGIDRTARTFLAFTDDPTTAHACFALVLAPIGAPSAMQWVQQAHVEGAFTRPPPTSWALASLSASVHHPKEALSGLLGLVLLFGVVVIARRPGRRRSRP
jgi:hypothetical protein